jgi:hypothetical protein
MADLYQCYYHPSRILAVYNQLLWTYSAKEDSIHILFTFIGVGSLTPLSPRATQYIVYVQHHWPVTMRQWLFRQARLDYFGFDSKFQLTLSSF